MWNKILEFLHLKKKAPIAATSSPSGLQYAEPEKVPEYEAGYDKESNTVIRLLSKKKLSKAYQVTGIDDVAAKNNWRGWIFLVPVIVLVVVFLIYPLINTIFIAFTENYKYATGEYDGFTLNNFGVILNLTSTANGGRETSFVEFAIPNTLVTTFVTVPVSIGLALIIAVALNSIKVFRNFFQTIFFLPYVTNGIAVGMVFSVMFDDHGVINFLFNTNTTWVYNADRWTAMIPLCLYIVWNSLPFKILILLSGLQGIDKQYYQAAQIDGASRSKILGSITVPLLSPQILYLMVTSFMGAFKEYTSVVSIFNGPSTRGNNSTTKNMLTIVYYVYDNLADKTSLAAAAAVFLFVIILLFTALQFRVSKRRVHY